jgi:hypothetical protein
MPDVRTLSGAFCFCFAKITRIVGSATDKATAVRHDKMSSGRRFRFRRWSIVNGRDVPCGVARLPLSRAAYRAPISIVLIANATIGSSVRLR